MNNELNLYFVFASRIWLSIRLLFLITLASGNVMAQSSDTIILPQPSYVGKYSLEQLLAQRRSIREYPDAQLTLNEIGQLLWAAQGVTDSKGFRTAPSAGALYPLELYVVTGHVEGLAKGIYRYQPDHRQLLKTVNEDVRARLAEAALSQSWVKEAAAVIVFTAVYERTMKKYGKRGKRYVHIEVGHAAQNLFLQSEALNLATVVVGAFDDDEVKEIIQLPTDEAPLMLMPIGRK